MLKDALQPHLKLKNPSKKKVHMLETGRKSRRGTGGRLMEKFQELSEIWGGKTEQKTTAHVKSQGYHSLPAGRSQKLQKYLWSW